MRLLAITALAVAALHGQGELRIVPAQAVLRGPNASQQFLVIGTGEQGAERDLTATAHFALGNPRVARLEATGRVYAVANGRTELVATAGGKSTRAAVLVEAADTERPFSFARDVETILTRRGCNSSGCHGGVKGQGGFKLSAGGGQPKEDYQWIVEGGIYQVLTAESGGPKQPRVDRERPENSLVLQKPSMQITHGGGLRIEKDSDDYKLILDWIRRGALYGEEMGGKEPSIVGIEAFPRAVFLKPGEAHRLLVTAHLSNGQAEDLTYRVMYSSHQDEVAAVSGEGIVGAKKPGETAILIRAAGHVASVSVAVISQESRRFPEIPRSNFIDEHVFTKLKRMQIVPSELSGDSEFLRRVCLDVAGRMPPPERVREFLGSRDPKKRQKLIDALLESPEYVDYWTFRFADLFRVAVFPNGISPKWSQEYWEWIHQAIAENRGYDQIARERIAAQGYDGPSRHYLPYAVVGPAPDMMAEQVRVFFGRRLDCAQCHNHPYENWTQDQFWGMTAFFGQVFKLGTQGTESVIFDHPGGKEVAPDVVGMRELRILNPRTKRVVPPTLLNGKVIENTESTYLRMELARWMTAHPYFAEAAVNRMWSYFFGRGIVDPVDDFRSTNPPSHPELLGALADDFRKNGYDLKRLIRLIVSSRAYQLSGNTNETDREDRVNYSHAWPRPLDAEILLDAISDATGVMERFSTSLPGAARKGAVAPPGTRAVDLKEPDLYHSQFLDIYGRPNRLAVPERRAQPNLRQALHVLAGNTYNEKLLAAGGRLDRLMRRGASNQEIVEEMYLAALARFPSEKERKELEQLIGGAPQREQALGNLLWAVLSSREFAENH